MKQIKKVMYGVTDIGSLNIGDEIIMESFEDEMKDIMKDNYVLRHPTHTPTFKWYQRILKKKTMNIYSSMDYKFIAGTNLLYTDMLRPMPGWNTSIFDTDIYKNSILTGVGCGTNSKSIGWYTKILYNKILNKNFTHSTRDDKAKEIVEYCGGKAINTGCVTLWRFNKDFCKKIPKTKSDSVVFTLTFYTKDKKNDKALIELLQHEYKNVYFWPQCIGDLDYFNSMLIKDNKVSIIAPNLSSYKNFLSETNTDYVGSRLHGGVYSMHHFRRSIILEIDYRVREMKKTYNLPSVPRQDIPGIKKMINSEFHTDIIIDDKKICEWKSQFK